MRISSRDFISDNLVGTNWVGVIEDVNDPLFEGRCRIRVFGKFDLRESLEDPQSSFLIPTDKLPWARPGNFYSGGSNSGSGTFSVPKLGSFVKVTFENGNIYSPVYYENIYTSDEVKAEVENSYQNSHVLIYDTTFGLTGGGNEEVTNDRSGEGIKVFFTEEKGLVFDYATTEGSSIINIRPDNTIYIEHAGGKIIHIQSDKISIGKENESDEPAVLGEKNVDALTALADQIKALSQSIQTFAIQQAAVASSTFLLSPLAAALTQLGTDQAPIISQIEAPIKSTTIPQTRSSTISIDGPPLT
jgi:uncharacterized protein involved in type VI secretion and phage assembly